MSVVHLVNETIWFVCLIGCAWVNPSSHSAVMAARRLQWLETVRARRVCSGSRCCDGCTPIFMTEKRRGPKSWMMLGWFYKLRQVALIKKDPWALGPKVPAAPDTFDFCFTFLKLQCWNARILGQTYSTKKQPESANSTFSLFHVGVPTKPFIHGLFS